MKVIRLALQQLEGGFLCRVLERLLCFDQMSLFLFVALAEESLVEFLVYSLALSVRVGRLLVVCGPTHGIDSRVGAGQLRKPWQEM